ncbi:hypothetical protein ACFRCI_23635 [Streptomyces sp. NPDC056638]|uniref:hypothetical protein n=1 Tax=Streptomyces sp. NPDC056638 TaxID=3345887 RepID=UPI00369DF005
MIIITGPQRTPDELGDLHEAAGILNAELLHGDGAQWVLADVEVFYRLAGWDYCTHATTDVQIAEACGWIIKDLPA